jgi:putative MATE family efflux protein
MNKEKSDMLAHMNVKKLLIKLAIPATAAMIVNALYNLVDTFFVAQGSGTDSIGALSIAYPIQLIVLGIGLMIGVGSSSVFSRAFGRKDTDSMKRSVNTAIFLNLFLTLTISFFSYIFLDELLILFGATEGNIGFAREYMSVILIALVPYSLSIMFNNLTRAEGRPKIAMWSLIIGAGLNIVLDPIFIFDFGLGLGVQGAAIATGIGKTASFVYVFRKAMQKESSLKIDLKHLYRIDFGMIKEIVAVGLPSFTRIAMGGILIVIVNNLIKQYAGAEATTYQSIYGVINRLIRFSLMPGFGLVQGMVPIVGFNFGAKLYQRLHDVIDYASKLLLGYFSFMFVVVLLFAEYLFMIFTPENNDLFISEGAYAFRIVALGFSFITYQVILSSGYQAMGYPVRAFIVALSRRFILFIPIAYLLTYLFGVNGIWWTFFAADIVTGSLSFLVYKYEMKDLRKKMV